tara:strand:+ start:619 stop:1065 length:447 start_codon:yes stop_codon:yes gene_type:complete
MLRITIIVFALLVGCATPPANIQPTYTPTSKYFNYTCDQLNRMMQEKYSEINKLYKILEDRSSEDFANATVGYLLWFPSLFEIQGDGPETRRYASLVGEYKSMQEVVNSGSCRIAYEKAPENSTIPDRGSERRIIDKEVDKIGREIIQ